MNKVVAPISTPEKTQASVHCAHCGDPCGKDGLVAEDLHFCCSGCQTVHTLLAENGLDNFYALEATAGRSQQRLNKEDYSWLDNADLARPFLRYSDQEQSRITLELPQIHCVSCVWLLENLGRLHPGVLAVQVNFGQRKADILFRHSALSLRELAELLARIGYPPAFHKKTATDKSSPTNRRLLYQIGLAGFTFGNIMLLSFPEYLGLHIDLGGESFARFFGYLNLLLSLPLLLYSGSDYLRSAWQSLRQRQLNIDVPIAIGLLALFITSTYEVLSRTGAGYFDSLAGLLFFLLVGRWFQDQTFARLSFDRDYRHYFPVAARRQLDNGDTLPIGLEEIAPKDILLIRPGDLIPADGLLLNDSPSGIDYSFVTGENLPQSRKMGDEVFAGGRATQEALKIQASKTADQSYLLQLWREDAADTALRKRSSTDKISRNFTIAILAISLATLLYWWPKDTQLAIRAATAVLIIACPCALALAIPFTYGSLLRLLAKKGWYLKAVSVIEDIQGISGLVLDKTGTLTRPAALFYTEIQQDLGPEDLGVILSMTTQSSHPKSKQLAQHLRSQGVQATPIKAIQEISGQGIQAEHKGSNYQIGSEAFCGLQPAQGHLVVCINGQLKARYQAAAPVLRPGVAEMLAALQAQQKVVLLSGDTDREANYWQQFLPSDRLFFYQSPFDKQAYLRSEQGKGDSLLMLGDGLNDAGALKEAHVGIAVSEDMANFSPACDGILLADQVGQLPQLLRLVQQAKWILYFAYAMAFCYNIVGLSFAVQGLLSPVVAAILMPLSSLSIVVIGVVGTQLLAHAQAGLASGAKPSLGSKVGKV